MDSNYKDKKLTFWSKIYKPNATYCINPNELKSFIEHLGIGKLKIGGIEKVIINKNGIIEEISQQEIFNLCLKYVEAFQDNCLTDIFYKQGETYILSKKAIIGSLKNIDLSPLKDKQDIAYLFYRNCYIVIVKDAEFVIKNNNTIKNIGGYIWNKAIINRNFTPNNEICVFEYFLRNVTNNEEHFESVISGIGYLLHNNKNPSITKVVIISDENTEVENAANGGTGKGIIVTALRQFINVTQQNGKNLDLSNNRFAFQSVSIDTRLIYLDDVKKDFDFEQLFTVATNDLVVEQKNKSSFSIPFDTSPKIAITTNYHIKGDSSSHKRRKFSIFLNNYYSDVYTPKDDFKDLFFIEWDNDEWNKFDTFVIKCIRKYLQKGLVEYDGNKELKLKRIKAAIPLDVFQKLEIYCQDFDKYFLLKELGISNMKNVLLYAEYKGYVTLKRQVNGKTEFAFQKVLEK